MVLYRLVYIFVVHVNLMEYCYIWRYLTVGEILNVPWQKSNGLNFLHTTVHLSCYVNIGVDKVFQPLIDIIDDSFSIVMIDSVELNLKPGVMHSIVVSLLHPNRFSTSLIWILFLIMAD